MFQKTIGKDYLTMGDVVLDDKRVLFKGGTLTRSWTLTETSWTLEKLRVICRHQFSSLKF